MPSLFLSEIGLKNEPNFLLCGKKLGRVHRATDCFAMCKFILLPIAIVRDLKLIAVHHQIVFEDRTKSPCVLLL